MKNSPAAAVRRRLRDALWGAKWGARLAAAITVLAAIPALIRVFVPVSEPWKRNLSFPMLVAVYFVIGLSAGAVVGFFRDFAQRWWGRRVLGVIIGIPCMVLVVATFRPDWALSRAKVPGLVISGAIWGFCMSFAFEGVSPPGPRARRSRGG
jgi:hypothetical protein